MIVRKIAVMADSDHMAYVRKFEESEQSTAPARKLAERDRDYYDHKQWTADEEAKLRKRGQPVVTYNRIQRKVNYLKGMETQTRKDPKAFPREPGDDGSAQAATDALRYVCDDQLWDVKRSEAFENLMVEGTGVIMVGAAQTKDGIDPTLVNVPWDRFFADPYSRRVDYSDAEYLGIVTWMEESAAKRKFPQGADAIETTINGEQFTQTYDDRPKHSLWADFKRKRVRVIEMYCLEDGQWMQSFFTKAGYLSDPVPSPFLDSDGKPECPIHAMSAYVDRDNNRYGEVRAMISPQDEINHRRSKGLHLINSRQLRVSRTASVEHGNDASAMKREFAKPDGLIFAENGEVEVIGTGDMARANFEMLQEAKAEIDLLGPNAALAGKNENDSSGRALLAQQQGGMVEVALLMDRLRQLSLNVYRSVWARIKQYWDAPRWIRIAGDERNLKWVGLNIPKTVLDVAKERLEGDPDAEFKLAMLARDPRAQMVAEVKNPVAEMDIDIVIDEGMDTPAVAAEQFDTLAKMLPSLWQLPPEGKALLIQASSLRDKDKLLEMVEKMNEQGEKPPSPQEMMQAEQQAEMHKAQAQAQTELEKAQIKAATDLQVATIKAESDAQIKREQMQIDAALEVEKQRADAEAMERKAMLEHDIRVRVADATGETKRAKDAGEKEDAEKQGQLLILNQLAGIMAEMNRPKVKVPMRDANGLIVGIREEIAA